MTAGMSHLMFDRSIHSHCCPHKYFSASCSRWLPLCLTPAGLESEPAVCQLSLPHVVLGQFIPVAIFEKEYSDYIHLYWMICSSVPLSLFIIHARVTLYVLCCIYHPLTSSCKFGLFIQHPMPQKKPVLCDSWSLTLHSWSLLHGGRVRTKWPAMVFFSSAPTASPCSPYSTLSVCSSVIKDTGTQMNAVMGLLERSWDDMSHGCNPVPRVALTWRILWLLPFPLWPCPLW